MTGRAFEPDWVVAPGETLAEWQETNRVPWSVFTSDRFARAGTLTEAELAGVLDGSARITGRIADVLERVTFVPARFWLALEHNYRAGLARGARGPS